MPAPRPAFLRRLTSGVPLLITIAVHVVLVAIAAAVVVQQNSGGKKKTFEASASDGGPPPAVEHRLQVARRGGASGGAQSPVSANRIFSTAENALQMPSMPDLPSMGSGGFGGFGGMGSGVGLGAGKGMATSLGGGAGLGGVGFMSLNFLGLTDVRARKVVFAVDIGPGLLDIRKGGIRAFEIIRQEISRLVAALPPSAEFNVVVFANDQIRLYAEALRPATSDNKKAFFQWIAPINADLQSLGARSIPSTSPRWRATPNPDLKLDPDYRPALWINALHASLAQQPDTVFLITGSAQPGSKPVSQAALDRGYEESKKRVAEYVRQGYDLPAIAAARGKAFAKLRADFNAINAKLIAQKKDPFVIQDIKRVLAPDFQAALRKAGFTLMIDTAGWTDKEGKPMCDSPSSTEVTRRADGFTHVEFTEAVAHVARLQVGLLRDRASINTFLFSGPEENTESAQKQLSLLSSRNDGKFNPLTTKRLEELIRENP
jgi:hypothetical protein